MGKGSHLKRGPWSAADIERALRLDGWRDAQGGKHKVWTHPTKTGKIPVSSKWTAIQVGDPIFRGILRTSGIDKKRLIRLLNGIKD